MHNLRGTALTAANVDLSGSQGGGDGAADNVNVIGTDGADHAIVGGTAGVVRVTGLGERSASRAPTPVMAWVSKRWAATIRSPTAS